MLDINPGSHQTGDVEVTTDLALVERLHGNRHAGSRGIARRILIYSHDTFGLGNIRRMMAIAEQLVNDDPQAHVLMITGSPMLHSFRISERIDFIKLPCLSRDAAGRYIVRSLPLSRQKILAMRSRLIHCAVEDFQPDLIIVDKKPLGVDGELEEALKATQQLTVVPSVILVLRDILDSPEATRTVWQRRQYHDVLRRYYDLVLVAGQPEVFDLAREYDFPPPSRTMLRYCGYIQRYQSLPLRSRDLSGPPRVLVMVGGGGDGARLIRCFLQGILQGCSKYEKLTGCIITGPEMPVSVRMELQRLASAQQQFEIKEFSAEPSQDIAEADVVVSMCGYNTICEVLSSGKRAVVVPRIEPVQEQWIRADRFSRRGLLTIVHPDELTPQKLMSAVDHELMRDELQRKEAEQNLDFGGLQRIGHWVLRLLHAHGGNLSRLSAASATMPAETVCDNAIQQAEL